MIVFWCTNDVESVFCFYLLEVYSDPSRLVAGIWQNLLRRLPIETMVVCFCIRLFSSSPNNVNYCKFINSTPFCQFRRLQVTLG